MTIAITINVNDGIVFAADSAGSMFTQAPNSTAAPTIVQVYNNANKIVNLCKGLPIGVIFWGNGSIGRASISTLLKDLRDRFSGKDASKPGWKLDASKYTVLKVAERVKEFLFDEHYTPSFAAWPKKPAMGLIVAGYGRGSAVADEYKIEIDATGACTGPTPVRPNNACGSMWAGEPESITRVLQGYSPELSKHLAPALNLPVPQVDTALQQVLPKLAAQLLMDAMPIKDAIDVAEFLVELASKFSRYTPGAATVGVPVEIAAITKHEGFRWVKRKHYFSSELNPEPIK
jgi:hypothetical protein